MFIDDLKRDLSLGYEWLVFEEEGLQSGETFKTRGEAIKYAQKLIPVWNNPRMLQDYCSDRLTVIRVSEYLRNKLDD